MGLVEVLNLLLMIAVAGLIYGIVSYVIDTVPLFLLTKDMGYEYAWLVWIPLCRWFVLVKISETDGSGKIRICGSYFDRNFAAWFTVFSFVLGIIPIIGGLASYVCKKLIIGASCRDLYSNIEHIPSEDVSILGYFSGFFTIILIAKVFQYLEIIRRDRRNA